MKLAEAIQRFVDGKDNVYSRAGYSWVLSKFLEFVNGSVIDVADVTPELLDDWRIAQRNRGIALTTVASYSKKLRAFFNWCVKRGYISRSPAQHLPATMQLPIARNKAIPETVLRRMLELAQQHSREFYRLRDTAILALFVQYGLRRGGLAHLRLSGIGDTLITEEKGGRTHELPLTAAVLDYLKPWLAYRLRLEPHPAHDFVFVSTRHTMLQPDGRYPPLPADGIARVVRRLSQKAGGNYGPHAIRHWKGKWLTEHVSLKAAQDILGHSDLSTTASFYANQDIERIRRILEADGSLSIEPGDGKILYLPKAPRDARNIGQ